MAYPDYGAFLPTEALYTEPGAYSGVLKGEALKRASYLSEMDRFYEELRESSERFEKQYTLAERELEFTEEQALWEREFTEEQAVKKEEFERERLTHEESLARMGISDQKAAGEWQYKLGMEELEFRKDVEEGRLSEEEEWELASRGLKEIMGGMPSAPPTGAVQPFEYSTTRIMQPERSTEIDTGGWLERLEKAYPETEQPESYRRFMGQGSTISEIL